jgi:hypothetical protein
MGTTLASGIWLPSPQEPIDIHVTPSIFGAAAAIAQTGRSDIVASPLRFFAADAAAADAIKATARAVGDQIYRSDTAWIEELKETGWRVVHTMRAVAYTPDFAGTPGSFTPGNGNSNFLYWVRGERVIVQGSFTLGSTTVIPTGVFPPSFPVPTNLPMRYTPQNIGTLGLALGVTGVYHGLVLGQWGNYTESGDTTKKMYPRIVFRGTYGGGATVRAMAPNFPFIWSGGNSFTLNFEYVTG